ncbi:hypothetical protein HPB48_023375 [Haemaphysalis longicornis]|uniref:THAP-type domain-containing protein n=1 Tax=Haemaphysalis longicornis TaxID=44386 RepID=A0A9J6H7Y7_HAELO|nr:hypothetical protein HPB48_023375 [Haemaphysalis longicornis]
MTGCCAFNCTTQSGKGKALFAVPFGKHNAKRRKVWLHRIGRKDFQPTKSSKLCESHFTEDQFEPNILRKFGIKKLRSTAVPSIFSHRPEKPSRKLPHPRSSAEVGSAGKPVALPTDVLLMPASKPADDAASIENVQVATQATSQLSVMSYDFSQCEVFILKCLFEGK